MRTSAAQFHIGIVLSITGDRLVAREGFVGVQSALSYMAGEDIYTHQVRRVMDEAKPVILEKYPLLADVIAPADINEATVDTWLDQQANLYGEFLVLPRLSLDQHERIDPESEAAEVLHPSKIATIRAPKRSK